MSLEPCHLFAPHLLVCTPAMLPHPLHCFDGMWQSLACLLRCDTVVTCRDPVHGYICPVSR